MAIILLSANIPFLPAADANFIGLMVLLIGFVFAGLGAWAVYHPKPPLIIASILYFILTVADFISLASAKVQPAIGAVVFRIAIIVALVRAAVRAAEEESYGD